MRKNLSLVVLLDLSKAFDSLDHSRLLAKKKRHWGLVVPLWNGLEAICRDVNNTVLRPQVWVLFLMVYQRVPS